MHTALPRALNRLVASNLAAQSARYWGYLLKRYLFRLREMESPAQTRAERLWFGFYGPIDTAVVEVSAIREDGTLASWGYGAIAPNGTFRKIAAGETQFIDFAVQDRHAQEVIHRGVERDDAMAEVGPVAGAGQPPPLRPETRPQSAPRQWPHSSHAERAAPAGTRHDA